MSNTPMTDREEQELVDWLFNCGQHHTSDPYGNPELAAKFVHAEIIVRRVAALKAECEKLRKKLESARIALEMAEGSAKRFANEARINMENFKVTNQALVEYDEKRIAAEAECERLRTELAAKDDSDKTLTFYAFRKANVTRCLKWHPNGIGSWSPSDWLTAVTGELGELASLLKMRNRERDCLPGNKFSPTQKQIADEIADVLTYLDLLAAALGVRLDLAAVEKFNEVSERVGFPDRMGTK